MSCFTYKKENRKEKLEGYEWDNVWWEQADNETAARVLYKGYERFGKQIIDDIKEILKNMNSQIKGLI